MPQRCLPCFEDLAHSVPPHLEEERDGGGDGLRARRGDVDDERERLAEVRARARVAVAAREDAAELREPQRLGSRAMVRRRGDAAVTLSLIPAAVSSKRRCERGMSPFCTDAQTHRRTDTQTRRRTDAQTHTHGRTDTHRSWMISP